MSKRPARPLVNTTSKTKVMKHWSLGLVQSMKDPEQIVTQSENLVVIKDKYPKAKIHYLILPHENISSIHKLSPEHIKLMHEFGNCYEDLKTKHSNITLKAGFHAVPSMQRLHMHVISEDMISPCLKTKVHWNSFNTKFFIPYNELLEELKEKESIAKLCPDVHKSLLATPLQCNQCSCKPKTMPQLKEHLLSHAK